MKQTPKGNRLHIGIFGRRNVGKSSLLNAITRQQVSIVSAVAGTTTDPVEKPMELLPLGPVLFIDTAGIDDVGSLGAERIAKTRKILDRTDLGLLVAEPGVWGAFEEGLLEELTRRGLPRIVAFSKSDVLPADRDAENALERRGAPFVRYSALGDGLDALRALLIQNAPEDFINAPPLIGDLVSPGDMVVLVVPIDKEAPKGRIILPQVQVIRDLLDHDAGCICIKEDRLAETIARMKAPPALVVTDSQAFGKVSAQTPSEIRLTSFSILFSRQKGDIAAFAEGALAIPRLRPGDRVLVAEACTHHPIGEDIGRVKLPRWIRDMVGEEIDFTTVQGHDFPEDLSGFKLAIHCGSCMMNRREVLTRIDACRRAGVPITNYGIAIALTHGIFERALAPFPQVRPLLETLRAT